MDLLDVSLRGQNPPDTSRPIAGLHSSTERSIAINALLRKHGQRSPIVVGERALFLHRGSVKSKVCVAGDFNGWDTQSDPMLGLHGTDVHWLELDFPLDARIEYKFVLDGMWSLDPMNPDSVCGKFGSNSVLAMPRYTEPAQMYDVSAERSETHELSLRSKVLGSTWNIRVRLPRGSRDLPLLLVLDGSDYLDYGKIDSIIGGCVRSGAVRPFAHALVDLSERHLGQELPRSCCQALAEELVPFIESQVGLTPDASETCVLGVSHAGLVGFLTALTYPSVVGKAAAQSGYFSGRGYEAVIDSLTKLHGHPSFYLDYGSFETNTRGQGNIVHASKEIAAALRSRGCEVKAVQTNEGHNWTAWRKRLPMALEFLIGASRAQR
jgi:enterochelin esterase family protein